MCPIPVALVWIALIMQLKLTTGKNIIQMKIIINGVYLVEITFVCGVKNYVLICTFKTTKKYVNIINNIKR